MYAIKDLRTVKKSDFLHLILSWPEAYTVGPQTSELAIGTE